MAFQLVYTSVPAGLVAGRSGFSTVARHREIREALVSRMEAFSNVFDRGAQAAEDTLGLPVIYAFHHIRLGKADYHVLSRTRDSGSDYSGRVNHIAHSLVLEPGELEGLRITPAEALLALEKKGFWLDKWDGGDPRYFDDGEKEPLENLKLTPGIELPAEHWKKATGGAATAALPCEAAAGERCHLVVESDVTPVAILQLIHESLLVKDPQRRRPATLWNTSFTTHLQSSDDRASFQWSAVKKGSPVHGRLGRSKGAVIEIGPGLEAPSGDLAAVAETGKIKQAPAEGAGAAAADAGTGAAVPGMPLPSTRGVGIAVGEGIPLGGGTDSDAEDYDDKIAAIMAGESGSSGGGFSLRRLWPWALVAAILVLGAVLLVPRYLEKREVGALVEQLNQKLVVAEWAGARLFFDEHISKSEYSGANALKEPKAALLAAEELMLFSSDLGKLSKPTGAFNEIGRSVQWSAEDRKKLNELRETAKGQLAAWWEFEKQLEKAWTVLQLAMQPFEKTPQLADPKMIAADSEALTTPSKSQLSAVLEHFAEDRTAPSPYPFGTASEAIARISDARAKVAQFSGVVIQVRSSEKEIPESGELKDKVEKLYGDMRVLLGKVGKVGAVDKEALKPIEDAFLKLATGSKSFLEQKSSTVVSTDEPPPKPAVDPKDSQPEAVAQTPVLDWLRPTHFVEWRQDHQYQIELSQDFGVCSAWSVVLPLGDLNPESLAQFGWKPAQGADLRADLAKRPVFRKKLSGRTLTLEGQPGGLVDQPINSDFALRFAASVDAPAAYQVVFLQLGPKSQGGAARGTALIDVPLKGGLKRFEEDGGVVVRLQPALQKALANIVAGDNAMKSGIPFLRADMGEKGKKRSAPVAGASGFSFDGIVLQLLGGGGPERPKQEIEADLQKLTTLDDRRVKFHDTFAKAGAGLYKDTYDVEVKYQKHPNKPNAPDIARPNPVPHACSIAIGEPAQAVGRPPFVDYIVEVTNDVLNSKNVFDLSEAKGGDSSDKSSLDNSAPTNARAVLEEFVKANAGWANLGEDKYLEVRKAMVAVRNYASSRKPRITGGRGIVPMKKNDKGQVVEEWSNYLSRLRDRQRLINADVFFENWARLFTDDKLDEIWPYFQMSSAPGLDDQIAEKLRKFTEELADKERDDKFADQIRKDPLEKLGSWYLDLEIPGKPSPSSPDKPEPTIVPLIRFTEQGPAPPTAPPAAAAAVTTLAPAVSGSETETADGKGGGKGEDQAPAGETGKP